MDNTLRNSARQRLEQREADILAAATRLFAEQGFHGTSTRKIAAAAGVSEGTLFHYFRTKNILLLAILDSFYSALIGAAREGVEHVMETRERLLFLARNHLDALMDQQAMMMRLIQVYLSIDPSYYLDDKSAPLHELNTRYLKIFDAVVREGMERGDIKADIELPVVRDTFFGGLEYGMRSLLRRKTPRDNIAHYVELMVEPIWQGLQGHSNPPPANSRLEQACLRLEAVAAQLEQNGS
ncbi:hypothetical protein A3709_05915 [Halioglobus sp. HI00S01]|uniref:TetR/AcrR family transcriptional regulator n=1 Tax=Halioglobus sp. HI00S01 TaxID=1822214 RepID=UPI0007C30582|nr:TetR/AcrR family transcriptional regulator [Halioglobus sp. HI00S01]KZX55927.1 hypothetical protein A3709_05915 [Halioglobus sp. HI00S01]